MERLAYQDSLTALPNRLALEQNLTRQIAERSSDAKLAVAFIDTDDFKHVNDTWGHATGDQLLNSFADRLDRAKREGDFVYRMSGDEFVVLFTRLPAEVNALSVGERVRAVLTDPFELGATPERFG